MEEKGKCIKVTLEYENIILIAEGENAEKWDKNIQGVNGLLVSRPNMNPFNHNVVEWREIIKDEWFKILFK